MKDIRWDNLKPFKTVQDVPNLPRVEEKEWLEYYVPKLIEAGAIPKKELVDGQVYIGNHRRAEVAKWVEKDNVFVYNRTKFNYTFEDTCNHFEDDDNFALFVPLKKGTEKQFEENKI